MGGPPVLEAVINEQSPFLTGDRYTSRSSHSPSSRRSPSVSLWASGKSARNVVATGPKPSRSGVGASCLYMIGDGLEAGELRVPEDGPVSWTARADLAEADAAILAGEASWNGITPPLTATEAVTMAQIAALASDVTGREVRHVTVSDDEWREAKIAAAMPAIYADLLLGTFRAARRGDFTATDPALKTLLGRAPRTMRDVLAALGS